MPTLVIDNLPLPLYDQIQHLAKSRRLTPADTVIEVLETAFRATTPLRSEPPFPQEPFLTDEMPAPSSIPRPEGKPAWAKRVTMPLPDAHDVPTEE